MKSPKLIALDNIDLSVLKGEVLGLIGESGCGKTTLGKIISRLEEPTRGTLFFDGLPLLSLRGRRLRSERHRFQPVFQDPTASLNPRMSVSQVIQEAIALNPGPSVQDVSFWLEKVGLGREVLDRFPHQLSGGQRQRLGIARALCVGPELLIADEPLSSLDVSIQAQIINLFLALQAEFRLTVLFISHDLRVVSYLADRVVVLYAGRIMEISTASDLFKDPRHPYSAALMAALPRLRPGRGRQRALLPGEALSPLDPAPGCRFLQRCAYAETACQRYENELIAVNSSHRVACRRCQEPNLAQSLRRCSPVEQEPSRRQ